jgi:hypothetical protein
MGGPDEFRTYTSYRYGFKSSNHKVDRLIDLTLICSPFIPKRYVDTKKKRNTRLTSLRRKEILRLIGAELGV